MSKVTDVIERANRVRSQVSIELGSNTVARADKLVTLSRQLDREMACLDTVVSRAQELCGEIEAQLGEPSFTSLPGVGMVAVNPAAVMKALGTCEQDGAQVLAVSPEALRALLKHTIDHQNRESQS